MPGDAGGSTARTGATGPIPHLALLGTGDRLRGTRFRARCFHSSAVPLTTRHAAMSSGLARRGRIDLRPGSLSGLWRLGLIADLCRTGERRVTSAGRQQKPHTSSTWSRGSPRRGSFTLDLSATPDSLHARHRVSFDRATGETITKERFPPAHAPVGQFALPGRRCAVPGRYGGP